jgi:hypothetical protein
LSGQYTIVISGGADDPEAEAAICEASRKFVRSLQTHTDNVNAKASLSVAQFNGSHGGATNLFNPSTAEADEYRKAEEAAKETPAPVETVPVPEVGTTDVSADGLLSDTRSNPAELGKIVRFTSEGPEVVSE